MAVPYSKILIPLDGSQTAAQALPHAETIAAAVGAELILFGVVEDPMGIMVAPASGSAGGFGGAVGFGAPPDEAAHQKAMDETKRFLDALVSSLKHRKVNAMADMDTGDAADCIVDYAADQEVDLIVMSTHGRTGVKRWTYGSVAAKVLQAAPCPVLVVRPAGHG